MCAMSDMKALATDNSGSSHKYRAELALINFTALLS